MSNQKSSLPSKTQNEIDLFASEASQPSKSKSEEEEDELHAPYDLSLPFLLNDVEANPIDLEYDVFLSCIRPPSLSNKK